VAAQADIRSVVSDREWETLLAIDVGQTQRGVPVTYGDIARLTACAISTAHRSVQRLITLEFVKATPLISRTIRLTDLGRQFIREEAPRRWREP
jgi:DNA-binding IclR family transcriptional regulator